MRSVGLPEAPSAEARLLFQTIWQFAGEQDRWPTFGELDRRMDRQHDLDAWSVMRDLLDQGFLYGVGGRNSLQPSDTQEIALTVAGLAACDGSDEVLATLLDFVRHVTRVEKAWDPPADDPQAEARVTSVEIAEALGLTGPRSHLLDRLHLLMGPESWGWHRVGQAPDGTWTVSIARRAKDFRGVTDLEDYWLRRPKPWDTLSPATASPPEIDAKTAELDRELVFNEPSVIPGHLLQWIYDEASGATQTYIDCAKYPGSAPRELVQAAIVELERRHLVKPLRTMGTTLPNVELTASGTKHILDVRARWNDRKWRNRRLRTALLNWLYNQEENLDGSAALVVVERFLLAPDCVIDGRGFSQPETDQAAAYLAENGLIEGTTIDQRRGPVRARLTAKGVDCAEQDMDVADYLSRPSGGTHNYFFGPITGNNLAWGDHTSQQNTNNGLDLDALRTLVEAVMQALPTLAADAHSQQEIKNAGHDLMTEAESKSPDSSRLRSALKRLRSGLAPVGQHALTIVLTAAVDHVLASMGLSGA